MNMWDERYGTTNYYYGVEPNDHLRERHAAIPAGGAALCLGEGEGRNVERVREVFEGMGHAGRSAVVQLVARRRS